MSRKKILINENSFGYRLKIYREKLGFSQIELAKIFNITDRTISNYENNLGEPKLSFLKKILELGMDINWLLTGEYQSLSSIQSLIAEPQISYDETIQNGFSAKFLGELKRIVNNPELQGQIIQLIKSELGNERGKERASIIDEHQGGSAIKEAPT